MFPNVLISSSAFSFPIVTEIGTLFQILSDNTESILRFGANNNAPSTTSLNVQYSVGGGGPWTAAYANVYPLNGSPIADDASPFFGPYYENNFFRYRWENVTLGYIGPWLSLAGPTVKGRWDVMTFPIAPTAITSINEYVPISGFGGVDVTVQHSLDDSGNFSYTGMYISATGFQAGFSRTYSQYFALGWGASIGAMQTYRVMFTDTVGSITPLGASAQYYVLGHPTPGILGTPATI